METERPKQRPETLLYDAALCLNEKKSPSLILVLVHYVKLSSILSEDIDLIFSQRFKRDFRLYTKSL